MTHLKFAYATIALLASLVGVASLTTVASTWYVAPGGNDSAACQSPETPIKSQIDVRFDNFKVYPVGCQPVASVQAVRLAAALQRSILGHWANVTRGERQQGR